MHAGERLVIHTPGGGGYGDPSARQPDKIAADLLGGLISKAAARRDYGMTEAPGGSDTVAEPTE